MRAAARRHRTAGNSEEQDYFPRAARGAAQRVSNRESGKARSRVHTRDLQVELSAIDALLMPVHAALLAGSAPIPAARCPIRSPSTSSEEARTLFAVAQPSLSCRWSAWALAVRRCRALRSGILRRRRGRSARLVHPGEFPKLASDLEGVDAGSLPPGLLVTGAVHRAVMGAAKRNGEFITRLATECPRLHELQVMRIGRLAGTQEARLLGNKPQMLLVAVAAGRTQCEHALV